MQLRSSPFTYGFVGVIQNVWKIQVSVEMPFIRFVQQQQQPSPSSVFTTDNPNRFRPRPYNRILWSYLHILPAVYTT